MRVETWSVGTMLEGKARKARGFVDMMQMEEEG